MKKLLAILLVLAMCLSLCACGSKKSSSKKSSSNKSSSQKDDDDDSTKDTTEGTGETENDSTKGTVSVQPDKKPAIDAVKATPITLGVKNSVTNYADFTLSKIVTDKKILAPMGNTGFENKETGKTYIEVVFEVTNTGAEKVRCDKFFTITAVNAGGMEYDCESVTMETDHGRFLSQYKTVEPMTTVRLHCAISVPETETSLTLNMDVNGEIFSYVYILGTTVTNAKALQVGETIESADFATFTFNGISYTDDVLPSNTSGAYTHYPIDNADNTYLVVDFDLTNYTGTARLCDEFFGIKATYQGKYTYSGDMVVEKPNGTGFASFEGLAPLVKRHALYLIEVPKSVTADEVSLTIFCNGQEFTYTGK